eukprot:SAG11_NODE_271_length_11328_cov_3.757859_6_plen_107_part_00
MRRSFDDRWRGWRWLENPHFLDEFIRHSYSHFFLLLLTKVSHSIDGYAIHTCLFNTSPSLWIYPSGDRWLIDDYVIHTPPFSRFVRNEVIDGYAIHVIHVIHTPMA